MRIKKCVKNCHNRPCLTILSYHHETDTLLYFHIECAAKIKYYDMHGTEWGSYRKKTVIYPVNGPNLNRRYWQTEVPFIWKSRHQH